MRACVCISDWSRIRTEHGRCTGDRAAIPPSPPSQRKGLEHRQLFGTAGDFLRLDQGQAQGDTPGAWPRCRRW
jgi:hypothetical protein